MESRTMCHLIAKDKVAEQYTLWKNTLTGIVLGLQWIYSIIRVSKQLCNAQQV